LFLLYKCVVMFVLYIWKLSPKNVSYVISLFCVQWVTVRADCLFCWYWWNCLSSLFKLSFLNSEETNQLVVNYYYSMDTMLWFLVFNATFSYIIATSFSGGRSRSTQREPPIMGKQLVNFITCGCESSAPFFVIYKARLEPMLYWW
jgi:hypothetical protein